MPARFLFGLTSAVLPMLGGSISFNRDIRPIMSDTCFHCHGPDKNTRMAGLRLDIRDEALRPTKSGVTPIVPGKPDESAIIDRVFHSSVAKIMPPKYSHKDLTAAQKQKLRKWVEEGAEYETHWAYLPVRRPDVPTTTAGLVRNAIDAFVQSRLAKVGLVPSTEADRRTLLRRLSLDLTGLPPTAEEWNDFLKDTSDDAYAKVVERLLSSQRYAEKQAMYWLDAVRYADTCGFHGDNPFPAWPYRDYVLKSFRDNRPFDQFTREQLAGDLLPNATIEQKVASAYNRMNRTSAEGGIQPKEYLAKYAADRVRTTSSVFLGSTIGCSECHDHKFDPFTSRDFYSMKAFFADIKETGLVPDRGPLAWGSQLTMPGDAQKARLTELESKLRDLRSQLAGSVDEAWEKETIRRYEAGELSWKMQRPLTAKSDNGATMSIYNEEPVDSYYDFRGSLVPARRPGAGMVVPGGANPDNDAYAVTFRPGAGEWTAAGIEIIMDESLPGARVARGADRLVITDVEVANGASNIPIALATANSAFAVSELAPMAVIDRDPKTGWGISFYGEPRNPFLALRFEQPLRTAANTTLTLRIRHDSAYRKATTGRFRIAMSDTRYAWPGSEISGASEPQAKQTGLPSGLAENLKKAADKRTEDQQKAITDFFHWSRVENLPVIAAIARLEAESGRLDAEIPRVVVTEATEPSETRILPRGNFLDESGDIVQPAIPAFLGKLDTTGRATRLDLANWLVSPQNPLTARVFANRTWRQFFGTGLSKVLDDLGSQGESPLHAELLDWLASEFQEKWDVKHLLRTIVMSHTYRQSSMPNAMLDAQDPDNRLLARQNRYRIEAELVRDIMLASSGLLQESFGGPSVRPPQPEGYLGALNFPKRDYSPSRGADLYRRSIYTRWQRTFPHPSLAAFDAPTREECTVNRTTSNTPLQALVLLNDPAFVEASRVLAQRVLKDGGATLDTQIDWLFLRSLNREPRTEERKILSALHRKALARFTAEPASARELLAIGEASLPKEIRPNLLAAMTTVTRAILNLHETITRN